MISALQTILKELLDGPRPEWSFVLNPGDRGLLHALDQLSAAQASAIPSGGGASIAAHVDHLRYGFELMNRWSRGEQPFADADYSASWKRLTVSEPEWTARRRSLRDELYAWRDALSRVHAESDVEVNGVVSSVVHLAYHIGAIRQIDRSTRGPAASD